MTEALLTTLSIENPSTLLSMDSGIVHEETELNRQAVGVYRPPDINLPLAGEFPTTSWLNEASELLDVGLAPQVHDVESLAFSRIGKRNGAKRADITWGAWFFFNYYFRPVLNEKSKGKLSRDGSVTGVIDKGDLKLDHFLVQHDMENIYMWVFKDKPENTLGKMQLRSYMNGHAKSGEPQFPYSIEKGFARSHKMQRKQYKGLSNPQCIHGIELVRCPNLSGVSDEDRKRWIDLTGRELNFNISLDASAYSLWRSLPSIEFDFEKSGNSGKRPLNKISLGKLNGTSLNLSTKLPSSDGNDIHTDKKKKKEVSPVSSDECCPMESYSQRTYDMEYPTIERPPWLSDFTGVMTEVCGPVTGAKTIYEDEKGYLMLVSLPFTDMKRVRVSWLNTATHGVIKIHCTSTARTQYIKRGDRTFELTDPSPEHCPPGEFVREIALTTRIPENAELEAFYTEAGAGLEILIPKHDDVSEEREVRVFWPPQMGHKESQLS
ncbi:hypothetical protein KP509_22G047300 [Ceratopteris richardii]|uniref:Uncharacterized protein n=1 Tax=Ceratopteris richardii TaxID=49495 RepID=A0A8T2S4T0_CERRI|nr:hypothetical protein KP509_22G047300 [Ceratopteris richardii]KAH7307131.1 hypothetical protein KP509_22G047300 [Ceratopteris richardii]KAH7307132.1 hypothetical protein KP509_22G047300 [Ceratopteris richardii]KAH7307133.1 hypothetical protein KP509_22G047300 [Ceratopteris richardii]KAH7307134.1 hypothetical protein KP509_22G047300 [Ceratopteris richardii]